MDPNDRPFTPQITTRREADGLVTYRLNRYGKWFAKNEKATRERFVGVVRRTAEGLEVSRDEGTWHRVQEEGLSAALAKLLSLREAGSGLPPA